MADRAAVKKLPDDPIISGESLSLHIEKNFFFFGSNKVPFDVPLNQLHECDAVMMMMQALFT